jgi:hypothetical protein
MRVNVYAEKMTDRVEPVHCHPLTTVLHLLGVDPDATSAEP